ncbi:hypothetical protein Micbo1qcDRAFT_162187 [Microdochium bolleyi]|uniref:Pentatricopeptide repeat domain-containing protein n=1 Tax=Microdochium bolleyi TaxID=196109 RepID=A0A136J4F3_9PEZI|nr:hypothetical protein Micbo1qcDRAFT_162187 [Microdochium bolleyi]
MTAFVACLRQHLLKPGRAPVLRARAASWQKYPPTTQYRFLQYERPARAARGQHPTPGGRPQAQPIWTLRATDPLRTATEPPTTQLQRRTTGERDVFERERRRAERPARLPDRQAALRVFVRPAQEYSIKAETRRSQRKHINSVDAQTLHDLKKLQSGGTRQSWQETFDLLVQNTPKSKRLLKFKVTIGKRAAVEARNRLIDGLDTNIWQISRRYQSVIQLEEGVDNSSLALNISGSDMAVRQSLLEVLRVVGELTALRVDHVELRAALMKDWEKGDDPTSRVRLLGIGEVATEDETLTLREETHAPESQPNAVIDLPPLLDDVHFTRAPRHRHYELHQRADAIVPPSVWTKYSFEKYVAALTHGEVPPQKVRELYGAGPSHQEIVTSLLIRAFTSSETRSAISVSALKLALLYLQKLGPGFRPANERIYKQIERQDLPADADTYTILLVGASKAGDIDSYTGVLKTMIRKGFKPPARAWFAFLEMTQMRTRKLLILRAMRRKGLGLTTSVYNEMARHGVLLELESQLAGFTRTPEAETERNDRILGKPVPQEAREFQMSAFLAQQCAENGPAWLDTWTMNKMLELLGRAQENSACEQLLEAARKEHQVKPDVVTLNTMLTHVRSIPTWLDVMERMYEENIWIKADRITYQILFSIAWALNKPNMMAVIWRYATMAQLAPSKMQNRLNSLFFRELSDFGSVRLRSRMAWSPIMFGKDLEEAAAAAAAAGKNVTFFDIAANFQRAVGDQRPVYSLPQKLREAYHKDALLYKLNKETEKGDVSEQDFSAYTVEIPLKAKPVPPTVESQ